MDGVPVFVDVRCLQDPRLGSSSIRAHARSLLNFAPKSSGDALRLIALVDPSLSSLEPSDVGHFSEVVHHANPVIPDAAAAFVATSPMSHQPSRYMRLLGHRNVVSAALFHDFVLRDLPEGADSTVAHPACVQWPALCALFFPPSGCSAR